MFLKDIPNIPEKIPKIKYKEPISLWFTENIHRMKKYNINLFILNIRPWPIIFSFSLLFLFINLASFFYFKLNIFLIFNIFLILLIIICWWKDVIIESTFKGFHNNYIIIILIYRMILFIVSEIFFFIRFFWTYFHFIFSPDIFLGSNWPYFGIVSVNFINLPLLNSILLIRSGCTVTFRHYKILRNNLNYSKFSLFVSFLLGTFFLICQLFEYLTSLFRFSDGCFGSIFFIATGFHGIHVLIGSIFLFIIFFRLNKNHFSYFHLIGFEFSIWYWHFVDVVWLYLYMIIYWLGR